MADDAPTPWSTASVEVKDRYARAEQLACDGAFDEATAELVWVWQNLPDRSTVMSGVRGSFMAAEMWRLAMKHAPARERFTELLDEAGAVVDVGAASSMQLRDWALLCKILREEDRIVAWFDRQRAGYDPTSPSACVMEKYLVPLLRARGRWADLGRLFAEPLEFVRRQHHRMVPATSGLTAHQPGNAAKSRSIIEHFLSNVAFVYAALCAAGRGPEAQAVLDELRRLSPRDALDAAVAKALKEAGLDGRRVATCRARGP